MALKSRSPSSWYPAAVKCIRSVRMSFLFFHLSDECAPPIIWYWSHSAPPYSAASSFIACAATAVLGLNRRVVFRPRLSRQSLFVTKSRAQCGFACLNSVISCRYRSLNCCGLKFLGGTFASFTPIASITRSGFMVLRSVGMCLHRNHAATSAPFMPAAVYVSPCLCVCGMIPRRVICFVGGMLNRMSAVVVCVGKFIV